LIAVKKNSVLLSQIKCQQGVLLLSFILFFSTEIGQHKLLFVARVRCVRCVSSIIVYSTAEACISLSTLRS